jgi:hypothetical protein
MTMRSSAVDVPRLLACSGVTAFLVLFSSALPLSGLSGAAVPLVMTTLLLAVLAVVVAASSLRRPLSQAIRTWSRGGFEPRRAVRQCDPDAAGHVRPRAPGVRSVFRAS